MIITKECLNPLKRVNSILTKDWIQPAKRVGYFRSQSPQTGQFNSYNIRIKEYEDTINISLNPLKRVNSILTDAIDSDDKQMFLGLNPLKRVNSILTMKME